MGNSFTTEAEADSVSTPGEKCVLTSELEVQYDDLIEGILEVLKDPAPPVVRPVMKSTEVAEKSDKEFVVKVTLDGQKLDAGGYGDGKGTDKITTWMKVTHDPAESTITTQSYLQNVAGEFTSDATDAIVYQSSVTKVLKDPVRVEYWWLDSAKVRQCGENQATILKQYLNFILEVKKERKVKCTPDLDSLKDSGEKSIISAPMDEYTTYDKLFDSLTDFAKEFPEAEIQQVSETEVHITGPGGVEPPSGSIDVSFNKETGEISRSTSIAGKVIRTDHAVLHKEPLQLEAWAVADGKRASGKTMAKVAEIMLEKRLEALSSWW